MLETKEIRSPVAFCPPKEYRTFPCRADLALIKLRCALMPVVSAASHAHGGTAEIIQYGDEPQQVFSEPVAKSSPWNAYSQISTVLNQPFAKV
jgi:hypothetical protein